MPRIDFLISNNGHHTAMFKSVVKALLAKPGYQCRVASLCNFRGLPSPGEEFALEGVGFEEVVGKIRRKSTGRQTGSAHSIALRRLARKTSWQLLLKPKLDTWLKAAPDLVLLPNDSAFPYNHICELLRAREIPFMLAQEGIRFPIPARSEPETYGRGGAAAVAAWGQSSAAYFRDQGVPDERIHLTGSPRFDHLATTDWQAEGESIRQRWSLGHKNLLFLSNPIDDQGFCTTREKLALVGRFIQAIAPLFTDDNELRLILKLHTRESVEDFQSLVSGLPFGAQVSVLRAERLYSLFKISQAAIVLASTAGLEALLFDLPLGVLEIPGAGFVHDYVASGAAQGLTSSASLADQVKRLLRSTSENSHVQAYVTCNLATRQDATQRVVDLVSKLVAYDRSTSGTQ